MPINKPNFDQKINEEKVPEIDYNAAAIRKIINDRIDSELDQSFPASDPPSYSMPGNDGLKPGKQDIRKAVNNDE